MKTYNLYYSKEALSKLPLHKINQASSVLVQIFSGICDESYLHEVIDSVKDVLPQAVILGATTDGEMLDENVSTNKVVISVTIFEKSKLHFAHIKKVTKKGSFLAGKKLAKKLFCENPKVMISFVDGLHTNGEEFLNGIASVNKNLTVSGGLAGDNAQFKKTFVMDSKGIYSDACVGVVIDSEVLEFQTEYKLNWQPIGKMLKITYAEGNRIYSIDNKNPVEVYKHYLGEKVSQELPKTGVEFPLITRQNGVNVTRAVLMRHEDDSLSFAGNMQTGEYYQFGFANLELAQQDTRRVYEQLSKEHMESIFVYSCMARRRFSSQLTSQEIAPLAKSASLSGFFTYGEFFHTQKNSNLLNQSMTILAMTENPNQKNLHKSYDDYDLSKESSTMQALSHLITVASSELEEISNQYNKATNSILVNEGPVVNWRIRLSNRFEVLFVSSNVISFLGYSAQEFLSQGVRFLSLIDSADKKAFIRKMREVKAKKKISFEGEFALKTKKGTKRHFHYFMSLERASDGSDVLHGYMIDVTVEKESKKKIHFMAYNDALTKLPNRIAIEKKLRESIDQAKQNAQTGALMFLDLNRFKQINDALGHHVGDEVLKETARRLQACVKGVGLAGRLGGDEFVVILPNISSADEHEQIKNISKNIHKEIEKVIVVNNENLYISTSIGVAIFPDDSFEYDEVMKFADAAMYRAKKDKNTYLRFHKNSCKDSLKDEFVIENSLRKAIDHDEFKLLYQPQIDIISGVISGGEALLRWNSRELGNVPPDKFIPVAENSGQIIEIGNWVLREACSKIKLLQEFNQLPSTFKKISVNVSAIQFKQSDFVKNVLSIIKESGIDARLLELELTEGALVEDIEEAIAKIKVLKQTGLTFSIDDFGTGFSSLAYLKKFPIDVLKIDKSFIQDMDIDIDDAVLTETIIQMSKNLQLGVIAEGVEKTEHLDFLRNHGCQTYQGYLFSKPIAFELFMNLLFKEETISKTLMVKV